MISTEHRVAVLPGSAGVVARIDRGVVVIGGTSATVATAMIQSGLAEASGTALTQNLRSLQGVDVAAIVPTPEGFEVIIAGNGLVATPDGQPVDAAAPIVWVGIGPVPGDASSCLAALPYLDLQSGCVPGQGALIASPVMGAVDVSAGTEKPEDATDPSAPVVEPGVDAPAAPSARAPGGPVTEVMGIQCSRGHFNNPRAAYCQVCGISMVHTTHYLVPGPRPTLGFIVFDDGVTFALDRSYCIGREPVIDPGRDLSPLILPDNRHSVSRSHAELVLDGWDLVVRDLGSTNGTFAWDSTHDQWNQVLPDQPVIVEPRQWVAIGRKVFIYESVARPM